MPGFGEALGLLEAVPDLQGEERRGVPDARGRHNRRPSPARGVGTMTFAVPVQILLAPCPAGHSLALDLGRRGRMRLVRCADCGAEHWLSGRWAGRIRRAAVRFPKRSGRQEAWIASRADRIGRVAVRKVKLRDVAKRLARLSKPKEVACG